MYDSLLSNKNEGKSFWKIIKQARSRKTTRALINLSDWKKHFERVLAQHFPVAEDADDDHGNDVNSGNLPRMEQDFGDVHIPDLDDDITEQEVRNAIRRLKNNKASGLDQISAEFLKTAETIITPFLTKLFNHLYESGTFPAEWCKSVIVPLFKKGDEKNPEN